MCFHGSSDSVAEAVVITFRPEGGEARRRFKRDNLLYIVAAVGPITFLHNGGEQPSENYRGDNGDQQFQREVNDGTLVEIDREAFPTKPVDTRTDRLKAAEEDTGFSLGELVTSNGKFGGVYNGRVVGFARVDEGGEKGIRKVIVTYTKTVTELFSADDLV